LSFVEGPLFACAGALAASGGAKLRNAHPAAEALRAAQLPSAAWLVRALAAGEVGLGLWILVRPRPGACLLLAVAFAALGIAAAGFARNPRVRSCGCFGEDAPPNALHVVLDLLAAAVAAAAAFLSPSSLPATLRALGWWSIPFLAGVWGIIYAARAVGTHLQAALSAYRGHTHGHEQRSRPRDRHRRAEDVLRSAGIVEGHPSLWGGRSARMGAS